MPASTHDSILTNVASLITGLGLKDWNNNAVPVAVRKIPKAEDEIDALPLIVVATEEKPFPRRAYGFGPVYRTDYPIHVVMIAPGNRDFTTHLDTYLAWRQSIMTAFITPASLKTAVSVVMDVDVDPDLVIDTEAMNDNYDYGGLVLNVAAVE